VCECCYAEAYVKVCELEYKFTGNICCVKLDTLHGENWAKPRAWNNIGLLLVFIGPQGRELRP